MKINIVKKDIFVHMKFMCLCMCTHTSVCVYVCVCQRSILVSSVTVQFFKNILGICKCHGTTVLFII